MPKAVAQKRNTTLAADTIAGRSAGSVTVRSTCVGVAPRAAAASAGRGSRPSQAPPDHADHHRRVEEHQPGDDRDRRAVEAEEAERSALAEQLAEGDADHDGRQHERREQGRPQHPARGHAPPVEQVGRRQAERHGQRRADGRRSRA